MEAVITPPQGRRSIEHLLASHPLRPLIVERCREQASSPRELVDALGWSLGVTAYHVRTLHNAGALELVSERRVRGAVEHFYHSTSDGEAGLASTPLATAIRALETIVERYEIGALESIPSVAREALEAIR